MGKLKIFVFFFLALCISCEKNKGDKENESDFMTVLEYKTNVPLPGVGIDFYYCSKYDEIFGCQSKSIFSTGLTDNNGRYVFKPGELNRANQGIVLHKSGYWNRNGGASQVHMSPEAWIELHLSTKNNYPDTSIFQISVLGEPGTGNFVSFQCPADSVLKIRAFGDVTNTLNWTVISKDRSCYQYCLIDTLAEGVLTQDLEKFKTTEVSLSY